MPTSHAAHADPLHTTKEQIEKLLTAVGHPTPGTGRHALELGFWSIKFRALMTAVLAPHWICEAVSA